MQCPRAVADLTEIDAPERELSAGDWETLNRTIRYAFASEHTDRVNAWYEQLLPSNRVLARCRSFESALAFVEMGLGTAIVPELAVHQNGRPLFDIALYAVPLPPRITLLVAPDHYFALPHLKAFIAAFNKCAAQLGASSGAVGTALRSEAARDRRSSRHGTRRRSIAGSYALYRLRTWRAAPHMRCALRRGTPTREDIRLNLERDEHEEDLDSPRRRRKARGHGSHSLSAGRALSSVAILPPHARLSCSV